MMRNCSQNRGFSFIELIIAIVIMAIGLIPLMWFFSRSNIGTIRTRDEIYAQQYAAELFDYVTATGFDAHSPTDEAGIEVPAITIESETTTVEPRFSRRLFIDDLAPAHNSEWPLQYRTVMVEVSWVADQQNRSLRLTGIMHAPR
jgi:prepilin-type N-terminal cleavage/methylation domain-containing protein